MPQVGAREARVGKIGSRVRPPLNSAAGEYGALEGSTRVAQTQAGK
jgi:hypothetical protein